MGYAKHIGRIGALAFALGVGIGLGSAPGTALADETSGSTSSAGGSSPGAAGEKAADTSPAAGATGARGGSADTGTSKGSQAEGGADDSERPGPAGGPQTDDAGGATDPTDGSHTGDAGDATGGAGDPTGDSQSDDAGEATGGAVDPRDDEADVADSDGAGETAGAKPARNRSGNGAPSAEPTATASADRETASQPDTTDADVASSDDATPVAQAGTEAPAPAPRATSAEAETVSAPSESVEPPASARTTVGLATVLSSLLHPGGTPGAPVETPALWVLAAAARRQLGQTDAARLAGSAAIASTTALLTPEQAAAIHRLGDIAVGRQPLDVVASDTRAYVANAADSSVTVIDTITGTVLGTIALAGSPTTLAITPDGSRVYAAGAQAGRVWVIDTATGSVTKSIKVGHNPSGITVSPTGNAVYVVNRDDGTVSKISTVTNSLVGTVHGVAQGYSAIAVSPDGTAVYTTSLSGAVSYFSSTSLVAHIIPGVTSGSLGLAFAADGSRVYVSDPTEGSVHIIDTATHQVVDSIDVPSGAPFSIAVSADGATLYIADGTNGTLSLYDIATKTELSSIVADPNPPETFPRIALSPDGTQVYLTNVTDNLIQVISLIPPTNNPVAGAPVVNPPDASGNVTGYTVVTDVDGDTLSYSVNQPQRGTVDVTPNGAVFSFTYVPTAAARHAAATAGGVKTDSFEIVISDANRGYTIVTVPVTIAPANAVPTATARSSVSLFSGNVRGTVIVKDADRDSFTFVSSPTAKGGTVTFDENGKFTYTPTAAARHAAAAAGATDADKYDTFDVTVDDGHGGSTTIAVTVKVKPGNEAPTATVRTKYSAFSPKVTGIVRASDLDTDTLTYSVSPSAKGGTVSIDAKGRFTYIPTDAARHAAAAADGPKRDKVDTFDVLVSDGHGATTKVSVTVRIKPANSAPTKASVTDLFTNPNSGVVTGKITAADTDGDGFTYEIASGPRKGDLGVTTDGTFDYVPSLAARSAASNRFARPRDKVDSFRVTVDDGHGGTTTLTVRVAIAPLGNVNHAPTDGTFTAGQPNSLNGKVTGAVSATDPEQDPLSFTGSGTTSKGAFTVNADGSFSYTPSDAARHQATSDTATAADKQDTFTVTASDGYGGSLDIPVTVAILPSTNRAPNRGSYANTTDQATGVVTGTATARDAEDDPLTFSGSTTTDKGRVVVATGGGYTYTPTDEARAAAGAAGATLADKRDHFTVFVSDGHGGTLAIPVTVAIASSALGGPVPV